MILLVFLAVATCLFCLAIGVDLSPFLRGPAPYSPDWRWEYHFVNTASKLYAPIGVIACILLIFLWVEKKDQFIKQHTWLFLSTLIFFSFCFQVSVLFFSRSGIPVLLHRIINPELNGYFTTALHVTNVVDFLRTFNEGVLTFSMHAQGHPPGAILFFSGILAVFSWFPLLGQFVLSLTPTHGDVLQVWQTLAPTEKVSVLFSGFFIPFLSTLTLIPLYYSVRMLSGEKIAVRSVFLYIFIPNVVLFIPINDVFLPLFTVSVLFFFLKGIFAGRTRYMVYAGIIFSIGLFFSLSLLPLSLFYFLLFLIYGIKQKKLVTRHYLRLGIIFVSSICLLPLVLFLLLQFNSIEMVRTLMSGLPQSRAYITWVFYNLYDFLIFSGIPVSILFIILCWRLCRSIIRGEKFRLPIIFVAFLLMLLVLNFSGAVRGEVGRIWLPFMPVMAMIAAQYVTKEQKFTTKFFAFFLLLQAVQILVMQEFWVMLW